jgi:hypothetical protein
VTQTASNIVMPGPVLVYIAPHSTSALQAAPANTIAKGTTWGGNFVEVGYTKGGALLKTETEYLGVEVDQANAPVVDFITKQSATMEFQASEVTLANIKQALGYGTITSGSTESTFGVAGTEGFPLYYTVGFECYAPGASSSAAWYRRVIIWKARVAGSIEVKADKAEEQVLQFTLEARYEPQATSTERLFKVIDRVV